MTVTEEFRAALAGRYLVEREAGRGGMATVYLARDLRHERSVALKVLLPELGAVLGPERFLSEIRVTASLQHPNLLPLFDSGEAGGRLYYVMPFVEGESLRARLERERQLPLAEAVRIAAGVAGALDHAHRRGVVHRDLKPENILLQDGQPLVADFGIALAVSKAGGARVTQTGLSLGTPQYMSPEQAAADRIIDARSDIYSLACVLYEMLTGDPPHTGSTVQAVVARVLSEPARSVRIMRPSVPEPVDQALRRALEKLPADRFATAAEFAEALQRPTPATGADDAAAPAASSARPGGARGARWATRRHAAQAGAAVALLALGAMGAAAWSARGTPAATRTTPVRFALALPLAEQRVDLPGAPVVFSPDGRAVLYGARVTGAEHGLHYRPLDQLRARPLPGTQGARAPFFSPDGAAVGFVMPDGRLMTMRIDGGTPTTLATVSPSTEGAWAPGDVIILSSERGLLRVSAAGGTPELLTRVDSVRGERYHVGPRALADGRTVLFTAAGSGLPNDRIGVVSLVTGRSAVLDIAATNALAVVEGHLLVGRADGSIAAVPFDLDEWTVEGAPVPLVDGVLVRPNFGTAASAANDGSLVYIRGSSMSRLELVDEEGRSRPGATVEPARYRHPRVSPDGRRIALEVEQAAPTPTAWADVWVHDLASGVLSRLTSRTAFASRPEWTPDGRRIAFIAQPMDSARGGEVWWVPADGSGPEEPLRIAPKLAVQEVTFSPDGRHAVLREDSDAPTGRDLWLVPLGAAAQGDTATLRATPLFRTPFTEVGPRISPDGRWLAYVTEETGRHEVYVRPFPGPGGRVQVSAGGGVEPVWAADGRLLYRSGDRFLGVTLRPAPDASTASVGDRRQLFAGTYLGDVFRAEYDVRRDNGELVVLRPERDDQEVVVVLDWTGELRARTAAARAR